MKTESFVGQCRYFLTVADGMLDDLGDEHSHLEPVPGNKTAGWLLGHLCITGDFARRLCGRKAICPKEWRTTFRPGTSANAEMSPDEASLSAPNPFEAARPAFPTGREFVPYIMTGHLAYHLGQLGDWRRAAGLGHTSHL